MNFQEEGVKTKSAKSVVNNKITIAEVATDKTELAKGTPYRWKEWRIVRGDVSLFVWNDVVLIELKWDIFEISKKKIIINTLEKIEYFL